MYFGGPSHTIFATDILSGNFIRALRLSQLWQVGRFQYPFWAEKSDVEAFLRSDESNPKGTTILPNALPT